ncbi:MAG: GatB/YqeY domain-containing protein [Candidatus Omnitrophica bacterium]|nr:GatB/YqeY domain-containing protein [Candidatus Omnitrophota bacterium]MCB9721240.1 GatB/YqeY domain-containing protein [Candidatus Omnitrophota bacterium]
MLHDQIDKDYIAAMKAKDKLKSATLNFLRAQLKNVVIEKRVDKLEDSDVVTVLKKQIKQRQDSISQYQKAGRQDLVDQESGELAVLKGYLPEEMSADQIKAIIAGVISETGANSMKDMGTVMKSVQEKTAGNADNKLVSELVKSALMQS